MSADALPLRLHQGWYMNHVVTLVVFAFLCMIFAIPLSITATAFAQEISKGDENTGDFNERTLVNPLNQDTQRSNLPSDSNNPRLSVDSPEAKANQPSSNSFSSSAGDSTAGISNGEFLRFLPLPKTLSDGKELRPIALFSSQMDVLVSKDYMPISIEQLRDALVNQQQQTGEALTSQIIESEYVVELQDSKLICRQGWLKTSPEMGGDVTLLLGEQGVSVRSIDAPTLYGTDSGMPPFEFDANGQAFTVTPSDTESLQQIEYLWASRGRSIGNVVDFKLQLPLVKRSTFYIAVPKDRKIISVNAVASPLMQVASDLSKLVQNPTADWYKIEAGGVTELNLKVVDKRLMDLISPVLRRVQMQCDIKQSGMEWTCRFIFEQRQDSDFPTVFLQSSDVLSVKFDGEDVPFTLVEEANHRKRLTLRLPDPDNTDESSSSTLSIQGFTKIEGTDSWFAIPSISMQGCIHAVTREEIQLSVGSPLQIVGWQLPDSWKVADEQRLESGLTLVNASGPLRDRASAYRNSSEDNPLGVAPRNLPDAERDSTDEKQQEFRIMLAQSPAESSSTVDLRLEVDESLVRAKARVSISLDEQRASPITLKLEDPWELKSLRVSRSNRIVSVPAKELRQGNIRVWLEPGDIFEGRLELIAEGARPLSISRNQFEFPNTWFIRTEKREALKLLASITPAPSLTWSGRTALEQSRVSSPILDSSQETFFGASTGRTLWFEPSDGITPSMTLVRPSVAYSSVSRLFLSVEDDQIVERFQLNLESQSQAIQTVDVQTDARDDLPSYQWFIQNKDGSDSIRINPRRVSSSQDRGFYRIDLSNLPILGRQIIAKREFPAPTTLSLSLPTVPSSTAQDAEVFLDPALQLIDRSGGVSIIPIVKTTQSADPQRKSSGLPQIDSDRWMRLRYDPVNQPSLSIKKNEGHRDINVIWKERIRCIGSIGGSEQLHAEYHFYSSAEFEVSALEGWELIEIDRGGDSLDPASIDSEVIRLSPTFQEEIVHLVWQRKVAAGLLLRSSGIPAVKVGQAAVLSSQYRFFAMPDSFIVNDFMPNFGFEPAKSDLYVMPGQTVLLCRYEHVLAFGCLLALCMFAASLWIGRRSLLVLFGLLALVLAASGFWLSLSTGYFAWVVMPVVCGGLLASSTAKKTLPASSRPEDFETKYLGANRSEDFSVSNLSGKLLLFLVVGAAIGRTAYGQDVEDADLEITDPAINILVPVDREGVLTGEMVYVPRDLYSTLFSERLEEPSNALRFLAANYRVQIEQIGDKPDSKLTYQQVEAEYILSGKERRVATSLTIPIVYETVRRLELLDDSTRILPFERDGAFIKLVTTPTEPIFRIRVTFKPTLKTQDAWERLELPIPRIANAKVLIESDIPLDAVRLGGEEGWLIEEEANLSRTWLEDIGPTSVLEVDVRATDDIGSKDDQTLGRRYWVRVGDSKIVVDCELDVPEKLASGETFQFVILDSRVPRFIENSWRFVGSELFSPSRRLVTLQSLNGQPDPIRMVWTEFIDWKASNSEAQRISIPEVIASALGENADPWIALQCEPTMQFLPISGAENEPLAVDQFLASWRGYRGSIERAFVPVDGIPELSITQDQSGDPARVGEQFFHAHLTNNNLAIHYRANLLASNENGGFARLFVGEDVQVNRITLNGRRQILSSKPVKGGTEYYVRCNSSGEPAVIEVFGSRALRLKESFSLPDIHFEFPLSDAKSRFLVTRDYSINVSVNQKDQPLISSFAESDPIFESWVPIGGRIVSSWVHSTNLNSSGLNALNSQFSISPRIDAQQVDQLISLSRVDRRWVVNSRFNFTGIKPDVVSLELPVEWCEDVTVVGGSVLRKVPAIDESRMVLQVLLSDEPDDQEGFEIRSLGAAGLTRFSLPRISLLGLTTRSIFAAVPNLIDGQRTIWRTSAVDLATIPSSFESDLDSDNYLIYRATNQSYSIDLAPISEVNKEPIIFSADAHVLPDEKSLLVLMHWDIYPGEDRSLHMELPESTQVIGAWSNERPFLPKLSVIKNRQEFELPLSLDRYSQTVQLLVRTTLADGFVNAKLPKIVGLEARKQWLTLYGRKPVVDQKDSVPVLIQHERLVSLAESVIESVSVIGNAGQFDEADMGDWLTFWLTRYSLLSRKAGVSPQWMAQQFTGDLEVSNGSSSDIGTDSTDPSSRNPFPKWSSLSLQLRQQIKKFPRLKGLWPQELKTRMLFPVDPFEGYEVFSVTEYESARVHATITKHLFRQQGAVIPKSPFLIFSLFGLVVLWTQRNQRKVLPFLANPSVWLLMLGISCWVVMPVPIGAGIALLALLVPLISGSRYIGLLARHLSG